ncbi:MAG: TonB-dependent receptor, partial [Alphaproteobacteria bacterium]
EEIVVTARRRAEWLQAVPISVSAFSDANLKTLQADDISGIQYSVPNLYLDRGDASNAVIFLRGIGQNDSLAFVESGVAVYVDDVFISRTQAAFLDLFDVERLEVLRGPQGTLYGRNSPGGAIKFISKAPPETFEAGFEAGGGRFDFVTLKGSIGGPLVDGLLRGKVALAAINHGGFSRNSFLGGRDGDTESLAWRAGLAYTPASALTLTLTADGKIDRPDTSRSPVRVTDVLFFENPFTDPFTPTVLGPNADNFVVETNANGLSDLTSYGFTLKADWRISDRWGLESISSYRKMDFDLVLDTDGAPVPLIDVVLFQDQWQFSQEMRASYDSEGGFTFIGGVYYFHDSDLTLAGFDAHSGAIFGFPLVFFGAPGAQLADTDQDTDSIAVFGHATIDLTAALNLELGLRYTYDRKSSRRRFENFFDPDLRVTQNFPPFLAGVGIPGVSLAGKEDWDALTPRIAVSYQASADAMLYASVSRGFKSGGFDGRANSAFGFQPFSPEKVWAFEGGAKTSWLGNRLTANLAYFYNRYRDLQVTSFGRDPATGFFLSLFTNAAAARIQGVELELAARPTEPLTLAATAGFMDAQYKDFDILVNGVVTDVSDRRLVNTPKWNASVSASYEVPLAASLNGVLHVDGAYRSRVANELTDSPLLAQDDYVILNAFVALKTEDARWEVRAGGRNLTGREIRVQGFNLSEFPGVQTSFFGARRSWDVRLFFRY